MLQNAESIALLFPGQGAQYVGMGKTLLQEHAPARALFQQAREVLGYDLADICVNGPEERLNATQYSQPALFVCSMAAVDVLRQLHPDLLDRVTAAAGLSLGEYTAVCFAGGLDFPSALRLVQRRGQAMQEAADQVESGMASVLGLDLEPLTAICESVRQEDEVLQPANLLCPGNIAVSGHLVALDRLEPAALEAGAMKVVRLSVAGAFHTPLMQPAVGALQDALAATTPIDTALPIYSNVDATPHRSGSDICELLARQVVSPVRWEDSIRRMLEDGVQGFLEVGTGRILRGTLKRIDRKIAADGFGD